MESLLFCFHRLSYSPGWDPLGLSTARRPGSASTLPSFLSCCQNESPETPIWLQSILCFSTDYRLKSQHNVFSRPFAVISLQRFLLKAHFPPPPLHFNISEISLCLKISGSHMVGVMWLPLPENTYQTLQNGCQCLEETPEKIAEHSFKKHHVPSSWCRRGQYATECTSNSGCWKWRCFRHSWTSFFSFLFSFLLMHRNDIWCITNSKGALSVK